MRQKHVGLKIQFSAGVGLRAPARRSRARKRVGLRGSRRSAFTRRVADAHFKLRSRRAAAASPPTKHRCLTAVTWDGARGRGVSGGLCEYQARYFRRRVARGASWKRSQVWRAPDHAIFAGNSGTPGAKLLDRRQWNTREMRHIGLRSVVKTRTLGESRVSGDDFHRVAPVGLPANARKQTMGPRQ